MEEQWTTISVSPKVKKKFLKYKIEYDFRNQDRAIEALLRLVKQFDPELREAKK